ncbi:NAD(P)-binding domain-containing protein [Meiothermus sp.]|uniref:NAD(P)-binding domain-containing protein n=1 Tax=Meiothermus sp. TaxID=1955249 RepID=UPI00307E9FBE
MGSDIARRLLRAGVRVVGYDRDVNAAQEVSREGPAVAETLEALPSLLKTPRLVWLMLPAGDATEQTLQRLAELLSPGDLLVDGGNSNYKDSQRWGHQLAEHGILFADVGVSGGVWGLENGYGLMAGGNPEARARLEPYLKLTQVATYKIPASRLKLWAKMKPHTLSTKPWRVVACMRLGNSSVRAAPTNSITRRPCWAIHCDAGW